MCPLRDCRCVSHQHGGHFVTKNWRENRENDTSSALRATDYKLTRNLFKRPPLPLKYKTTKFGAKNHNNFSEVRNGRIFIDFGELMCLLNTLRLSSRRYCAKL